MDDVLVFAASPPRKPRFVPFVAAGVLGPLALVVLALWFGGQARQVDGNRAIVRAAYEKRHAAAELLRELAEAEAAQDGFVITGNPMLVGRYEEARVKAAQDVAQLDELYVGHPEGSARIAGVRALIGVRFQGMTEVIRLRQQMGAQAAVARITAGRGLVQTDQARAAVSALVEAEEQAVGARVEFVRAHKEAAQNFVWTLVVLSGVVLLLGLWALWRGRIHRYRVERRAHREAARLRAIFASTTDAIMILDPRGRIEAVNAATTRMLGYAPADLLGRDASTLLDVADGEGSFHDRVGLADGRLIHPNWLDRTVRHRDGSSVPVDIALGLMPLPGELHIVAAIRDISERKALERMKNEFVATVSHELRTPLTSVVGSLGLLRAGSVGTLPAPAYRLVEIAENNSRRLIRLINDILDIEKIGSGRMHFERQPIDLVKTLERAIEDSRGLAEANGARIELAVPKGRTMVRGDEERLLQVVGNLLSNAIRFSPEDGCVRVVLTSNNGQAIVSVEDEGPGIPPEFHGRIFERFSQATGGGPRNGTGLGLAISREIIIAHDGRIWFGKAENGGARLSFALPLIQHAMARKSERPIRILLWQQQAGMAEALQAMLEQEGWAIDCVDTAEAVVEGAQSGRYHVLLVEHAWPDASRREMLRSLRQEVATRTLPMIILSPRESEGDAEGARGGGGRADAAATRDMVDWIATPIDAARLLEALRRAIDLSAAVRPTILHVDDDADMLEVAAAALADQGIVVHASSLASARALLVEQPPDVVVLDLNLRDGSGLDLLPELLRPDGTTIPTIIYSAEDVLPAVTRQVDAVLVKSRRSLPSLARTIRRVLASASVELETP
ncbi:MAG TPA: ATP-binding protein [Sphingomonas sp.]|nr:ATP-binding protein [Sphingomonas sp.]